MSEQVKDDGPLVYTEEDLAPKRKKVVLGKNNYVLIGASAEVVNRYNSAIRRGMRVGKNADSVEFSDSVNEADAVLVAGCLCRTHPSTPDFESRDASGNPVTVDIGFVRRLPYKVQSDLHRWAKKLTPGLEDPPVEANGQPKPAAQQAVDEERALGNSQSATP